MIRFICLLLLCGGVAASLMAVVFLLAEPSKRQYASIDWPAISPRTSQTLAQEQPLSRSLVAGGAVETPPLTQLRSVPIAHETPQTAVFGSAFDVTLAIDATGDTDAAEALPGKGNVFSGEAKVLNTVQAIVSGPAFDVEMLSPEIQALSPLTENIWRWRATANEVGAQRLNIELFAIAGEGALPLHTFRNEVRVEVSQVRQIINYADMANPVFVLLGGIGSTIAGLFGFARVFRRRAV